MISLKQILIKGKRTFFILFVYPLQVLRSIVWLHMLHFIQGLPGVTQTMIHKDSQPLTSYVNIYPNITLIGKLSHREVVFGGKKKKTTKFRCIVFFFSPSTWKKCNFYIFQMCWICVRIQRSQWELDYKSSKWSDLSKWSCFKISA